FSWKTENQQQLWVEQGYHQIIKNIGDAEKAIEAIKQQGEGREIGSDVRKPYDPSDFPVDPKYQMDNRAANGSHDGPYTEIALKELSHYGRLLKIQQDALHNKGLPEVYTGENNPKHQLNGDLRIKLAEMIAYLTTLWAGNPTTPSVILWQLALKAMRDTAILARKCWENGVIPDWNSLDSVVTQLDLQPVDSV
ncbi:MAG: hypothetical protein D3914_12790, partial [Candidatus Electrothrix sp. LOE2]|nr:hypothetical protein [Candidatus Electrothrix sp. LOE2]